MAEEKNGKDAKGVTGPVSPGGVLEILTTILSDLRDQLSVGAELPGIDEDRVRELKQCGHGDDRVEKAMDEDGGVDGIVRIIKINPAEGEKKLSAMVGRVQRAVLSNYLNGLRELFATVHHAKTNQSVPLQAQALRQVDKLLAVAPPSDATLLEKTRQAILAGTDEGYEGATVRLRHVFSSKFPGPSAERLAYTLLGTQDGEGYQLCPKAVHQIGRAVPMEISKCRDNCIDSRVTRDGRVTCAYANWIKVVADNQALVNERLEVIRHPFNEENRLNVAENERGKKDITVGWEGRLEDAKDARKGEPKEKSIESLLDSNKPVAWGHQGDGEERMQTLHGDNEKDKDTIEKSLGEKQTVTDGPDDETIEKLLEDEHDPFSDEEAEMLIEQLLAKSRGKE